MQSVGGRRQNKEQKGDDRMDERDVGRPPKYKSVKAMQKQIDKYFDSCLPKPVKDEKGKVLVDKSGNPVFMPGRPPTITGLALALGFTSRQGLLNYQAKDEFVDTVTRAKARVEQYTEERLFDSSGANGAKFSLANNFKGWTEKSQKDVNLGGVKIEDLL